MTFEKNSLSATKLDGTVSREHARRMLFAILAVALVFRILVSLADGSFGFLARPDISIAHHTRALALGRAWLDGRFLVPLSDLAPGRKTGLMRTFVAYLIAPFYALLSPITGSSMIPGRIAIATYSLGLGGLAYALARELRLFGRPALVAAGLAVFWPGVVYRSVEIQREVFVALATLTVVWLAVRWARSTDAFRPSVAVGTVALVAACGVLFVVRPENLLVVGIVLAVATAVRYRKHVVAIAAVAVLALGGATYAATNLGTFIGGRASLRGVGLTPHVIDSYAHARAHGDSAYLVWLHYHSWLDVVLFAPLKVVYFLGSPMLWSASGVSGVLAGVSGIALLAMSAFAVYGAVTVFRGDLSVPHTGTFDRNAAVVLVAFLVVGVGAYSVVEMNGGAAFRRRIEFVPVIAIFATVAFSFLWNRIVAWPTTNNGELATDSENTILAESE